MSDDDVALVRWRNNKDRAKKMQSIVNCSAMTTARAWLGASAMLDDGALELSIYICVGKDMGLYVFSSVCGVWARLQVCVDAFVYVVGEECGSIYIVLRGSTP